MVPTFRAMLASPSTFYLLNVKYFFSELNKSTWTIPAAFLNDFFLATGPVPASPTFSYPLSPNTRSAGGPALNAASAPTGTSSSRERGPARPPRLSSYYPGLSHEEGSGLDSSFVSSAAPPHHSGSGLIAPTRSSQYHLPTSSSVLPVPGTEDEDMEAVPPPSPPTNHKPFIANRLDKLPLIAGKSSRIIIPANTFQVRLE